MAGRVPEGLRIRRAPLGGSALSQAAQRGELAAWYARCPRTNADWRSHAAAVRQASPADWLTPLAAAFAATGAAADRLTRAAAGGVLVTTGQQPGLFGGPAYTFSKAMSALALADALEPVLGVPVAPVFWAATDDADWMEAAVTSFATTRGVVSAQLMGPATEGVAMSEVPLGDLSTARAALTSACGSAAHATVLELIDTAYVPHATIGGAYLQLLRALLEPLGIAVLDASHPALRTAADPFLRQALRRAGAVQSALQARTHAITAAGYAPQVDVVDGLSLVFRTQLESQQGVAQRTRERVPLDSAATVAREAEVGTLGANVLLRPVLERALLPTVCYLAGPGEYAYFAQVAPVAEALEAAAPVAAPRWACEVVETRALEHQAALGLDDAALRDPHAAEQILARARLDENVADTFERLRVTLDAQVRTLGESLAGEESPVAPETVQGLSRDLTHTLDRFERRLLAGVKRRETEAMREVAAVRAALRPNGASPERVLNLMPILVRYGTGVLTAMADAAAEHAAALVHGDAAAPVAETAGAS
ncbi:MAG: bacillithiol biosynthesis BshC [Gemmatimonadaceae bacterium]|nr:bacillithiol biosynthesis BshC [Gemmatimonadaceae bacterium]